MGEQEFWTKGLSHNEYCVHFGNKRLFPFVDDFNVNIWDLLTNLPLEFVGKTVNAGHSPSHSSLGLPPAAHLALRPSVLRSALWKSCTVLRIHTQTHQMQRGAPEDCVLNRGEGVSHSQYCFQKTALFLQSSLLEKKKQQQHKNKTSLATQKTYWPLRPGNYPSS